MKSSAKVMKGCGYGVGSSGGFLTDEVEPFNLAGKDRVQFVKDRINLEWSSKSG